MAPEKYRYRKQRIAHWDRVSSKKKHKNRIGAFYHSQLERYYRFLIPPGLKILEIGCGHGHLMAALNPSFGVGVDFSRPMIAHAAAEHPNLFFIQADAHDLVLKETFDVIILSDLLNDLYDVQQVLENLHDLIHPGARIVLNFFNNLWRLPLSAVKLLGLGAETLEQNWLSPADMVNLMGLAGFDIIKRDARILFPLWLPLLSAAANRYLVHLAPFCWFALTNFIVARPAPACTRQKGGKNPEVSVIVPAKNEAGNIENIFKRAPAMGGGTEIIFVEGHSSDGTYETIRGLMDRYPEKRCALYRQPGRGKGDAVRFGFEKARGDVLMILDADLTAPPEDLPRFYKALVTGKGEFINGVRLVYPLADQSMRFFNILGNKFFSLAFSWLLGQPIKDTLCGTKVLYRKDYAAISKNRRYFGEFDPFGDFDLLFGAAKLNLKIVEMPIRYRPRCYGETNINRWRHGWLLLRMVVLAARRIKFI